MGEFRREIEKLYARIGKSKVMVLATSEQDRVTARLVSCVICNEHIYFQTDKKFIKYSQILANPNVALCFENVQIEGVATVIGHPLDSGNHFFAEAYQNHFKESFHSYSSLVDEVLVEIKPTLITVWSYDNNRPFREFFDSQNKKYFVEYYEG